MSSANIEFNITKSLQWRIKGFRNIEWQTSFNTAPYIFNLCNKSFIVAMLLWQISNKNKDVEHELHMLMHLSGCLYEAYNVNMYNTLRDKLPQILKKYDITVERKRCYNGRLILGFILGKKYTSQYRKNLITTWKLQGLI